MIFLFRFVLFKIYSIRIILIFVSGKSVKNLPASALKLVTTAASFVTNLLIPFEFRLVVYTYHF